MGENSNFILCRKSCFAGRHWVFLIISNQFPSSTSTAWFLHISTVIPSLNQLFRHTHNIRVDWRRFPHGTTFEHTELFRTPLGRCLALQHREELPAVVSVLVTVVVEQETVDRVAFLSLHQHGFEDRSFSYDKLDDAMDNQKHTSFWRLSYADCGS